MSRRRALSPIILPCFLLEEDLRVIHLSFHVNRGFLDIIPNMPLKYALGLASCLGTLVLAQPVSRHANATDSNSSITRLHPITDYLNLNFDPVGPIDEPSTPPSVTGSEDMHIQCNGASYGFDLSISDCEGANSYVPASADEVQWAERHTGWQKQFFPLPYRAMGDEASCYVQPVLKDGATSAKASLNHIRNAAAMIRNRCFSGGKLQGGMATNIGKMEILCWVATASSLCFARTLYQTSEIDPLRWLGGDNNLAVIMGSYKSPSAIRCGQRITFPDACQDILEDMPATTKMEIFGPPHTMSATVSVPQEFSSGRLVNQVLIYEGLSF